MRCTLLIRYFDGLIEASFSFRDSAGVWVSGGRGSCVMCLIGVCGVSLSRFLGFLSMWPARSFLASVFNAEFVPNSGMYRYRICAAILFRAVGVIPSYK